MGGTVSCLVLLLSAPLSAGAHDTTPQAVAAPRDGAVTPPEVIEAAPLDWPPGEPPRETDVAIELLVDLDATGAVTGVEVVQSAGPAFDTAAVSAMQGTVFAPARRGDVPIAVRLQVPVHFHSPPGQDPPAPAPETETPPAPPPAPTAAPPPPPPALDTVVRGRAPSPTASGQTLDAHTLRDTNTKSAEDLLRRVPGVTLVQHGAEGKGPQLYLRGFDAVHGSDVEVRLGDVPLNEPGHVHGHGYLDLGFIIPELVQAVDVQKGAFALGQGPFANAGTLRFREAAPGPGLRLSTEAGAPLRARGLAIAAVDERTYAAAEAMTSAGFGQGRQAQRVTGTGRAAIGRGAVTGDVGTHLYAARFALPGAVRLDDVRAGRIGLTDSYAPGEGRVARALVDTSVRIAEGPVRAQGTAWSGAKYMTLLENFTGDSRFPGLGDAQRQRQVHLDAGTRWHARLSLWPGVRLRGVAEARGVGLDQAVYAVDAKGLAHQTVSAGQKLFGAAATGMSLDIVQRWWRLSAGLRADAFSLFSQAPAGEDKPGWDAALSPRVSGSVRLGVPGLRGFFAVGRGVRPPQATSPQPATWWLLRTPGVVSTEGAEVGVRYDGARVEAALAGFATYNAGEVLFDHVARTTTVAGQSRRLGVESRAALRPLPWLETSGNVVVVDARLLQDQSLAAVWTDRGDAVPGVPVVSGAVQVAMDLWPGLRTGLSTSLLGPRPLRYQAVAPAVAVTNAFVRYRLPLVELSLEVDNLLDARYAEGAGMFASHWQADAPRSQLPVQHWYAGSPRMVRLGATLFL